MQRLWILHISPQTRSLPLWISQIEAGQSPTEGSWPISRYRKRIQKGDLIWFWQSGLGLVAQGICLSNAYRSHEDPEFHWEFAYQITHRCAPALATSFFEQHHLELTFFRRPQGHIFNPPDTLTADLLALTAPHLHPLTPRQSQFWPDIAHSIQKQGLQLDERTLRQYHLALQSQSLVILSGHSGTGKSWLTKAYAQATHAKYLLVPVAPNWMGPEDLLGYYNAVNQTFMATVASDFIAAATQEWNLAQQAERPARPFHLVLDEMNLARTEHYFSPLLSLLEVRRRGEQAVYHRIGAPPLIIPENLSCIGTANTESQPLHFSERIADRAFVVHLPPTKIRLEEHFEGAVLAELKDIWPHLNRCFHISYRTLEDLQTYLHQAKIHQIPLTEALDEVLAQKIMHRTTSGASEQAFLALKNTLPAHYRLSHRCLENKNPFSFFEAP